MSFDSPCAPSPELIAEEIAMVKVRLSNRFPDVAPERLAAAVDVVYHRYDHSTVRTFVPVLVEHEVRDVLDASEKH